MLDSDERPAADHASEAFADRAIPQFWDGNQAMGKEVARSLGQPDWTAWDIYLFYPPGVAWLDAGLPPAQAMLAQAGGVVVANKGTLPAVELDADLSPKVRTRVDIVGPQTQLDSLLARVAAAF